MQVSDTSSTSHVVLAKGAAIFLAGRGLGRVFGLAAQAVLARLLTPAVFGLYALGWTVFRLAELLGPLGLQAGALRFASASAARDPASARPVVTKAVGLAAVSGTLLGITVFALAPELARIVFHKPEAAGVLRWFSLGFPFLSVLIVAAVATQALQTNRYLATVRELGQPMLIALLAPAAVVAGFGVEGAAAGTVAATVLTAIAAVVLANRLFPSSERVWPGLSSRKLLAVSIPAAAASSFRLLLAWTDRFVVGACLPSASLGAYHAGAQLASILSMIPLAFAGILGAIIVTALATGEAGRARALYRTTIKWMLFLAIPVLVPLIVAPREALGVVFGPAYAAAAVPLRILAMGQGLSLLTGTVGALLVMTGHERRWAALAGMSFLTNLALSVWLTPRWGLTGAAFSTAVALAVLTVLGIWSASVALDGSCLDLKVARPLILLALGIGGGFLVLPYLPSTAVLRLVALLGMTLVTVGVGLVLFGFDPEEREIYDALRVRLGHTGSPEK